MPVDVEAESCEGGGGWERERGGALLGSDVHNGGSCAQPGDGT